MPPHLLLLPLLLLFLLLLQYLLAHVSDIILPQTVAKRRQDAFPSFMASPGGSGPLGSTLTPVPPHVISFCSPVPPRAAARGERFLRVLLFVPRILTACFAYRPLTHVSWFCSATCVYGRPGCGWRVDSSSRGAGPSDKQASSWGVWLKDEQHGTHNTRCIRLQHLFYV